ncbi:hypothetical protein PG984_016186 [Apiospora sp. TS-2023a]
MPWLSSRELEELPIAAPDLDLGSTSRVSVDDFGIYEAEVVQDQTEWTKDVPWETVMSQAGHLRDLFSVVLHPNESFRLRGKPFREYFDSKQEVCKDRSRFEKWAGGALMMLYAQRIFETQDGRVGFRPSQAIGSILFGCDMPVVLRPREGEYEAIGGCFVDGLMNGEVAEEVRNGNRFPETITLC